MSQNTRIYNRFEFWGVADCACEFCLWRGTKKRPCLLEACCCEDIRAEALRRKLVLADCACSFPPKGEKLARYVARPLQREPADAGLRVGNIGVTPCCG
jgi:hypothetical protein